MKTVRLQYFAILREQAGRDSETVELAASPTPAAIFEILRTRHNFSLGPEHLRVAVNDEFVPWDHPLKPNDHIVFMNLIFEKGK